MTEFIYGLTVDDLCNEEVRKMLLKSLGIWKGENDEDDNDNG